MYPEENRLNANQPLAVIQKYYSSTSEAYRILFTHSILVTAKALAIATALMKRNLEVALDLRFIEEAALLHDIGIFRCHAPQIFCYGDAPYVQHGLIGREILEQEGLPRHALVCERHTGMGLTREEVLQQKLPLPARDFLPLSLEEKIICLADRFYVKDPQNLYHELSLPEIEEKIKAFGEPALARWEELRRLLR
ncbi:MAG: HD domain-containing protein [bacterium]